METTMTYKFDVALAVLNELDNIGYLSDRPAKLKAIGNIRELLTHIDLPAKPTKAETAMYCLKLIANVHGFEINKQLYGIASIAKKAVSHFLSPK